MSDNGKAFAAATPPWAEPVERAPDLEIASLPSWPESLPAWAISSRLIETQTLRLQRVLRLIRRHALIQFYKSRYVKIPTLRCVMPVTPPSRHKPLFLHEFHRDVKLC
jgi:hypothetical protein